MLCCFVFDEECDFQTSCAMFKSTKPHWIAEELGEEEEESDFEADDTVFIVTETDTKEVIDFNEERQEWK